MVEIEIRPLAKEDDRASVAVGQRDSVGCVGVVTDAKSGALSFYERLGFVPLGGILEGALHGEPIPMFLGLGALVETTD